MKGYKMKRYLMFFALVAAATVRAVDETTQWWDVPPTNTLGEVMADVGIAAASDVAQALATANAANARSSSNATTIAVWETYWGGSNVVFEVTNYNATVAGLVPRLRIRELQTNGWSTVFDIADWYDAAGSNTMSIVAASGAVIRADCFASSAPRAWGSVTSAGVSNAAPDTVWMTAPSTVFAGGLEFQRVAVGDGAICVLTANGANAYTAGSDGTFRFQDFGGTNYFGFAKGDSYTLGANASAINVSDGLVELRYDVAMVAGTVPIIYWRYDLTETNTWTRLNNSDGSAASGAPYAVSWVEDAQGLVATLNCGATPSGFFYAETEEAASAIFETNMRAYLGGGIACTNTATGVVGSVVPEYDGTNVVWRWRP